MSFCVKLYFAPVRIGSAFVNRNLFTVLLAALLLLTGCSGGQKDARLTVVCSTYPIYALASALTEGADGVAVERLDTGSGGGCLHDYTLTVSDMKKIERADALALNGAGLEDFLDDALSASNAPVIDCSEGVELLESLGHSHENEEEHGLEDRGEWDPHYWMDPANAQIMADNLAEGLAALDPDRSELYRRNAQAAAVLLGSRENLSREFLSAAPRIKGLVTFHDGFQYFARALDVPLLSSIEEEAGSEASAREIVEISALVKEYSLPAIFTEVNGSDATAQAISRETGCAVVQLSMLMSGPEDGALSALLEGYTGNVIAVVNSFAGKEVVRKG